jgi:hypothetical protein
MLSSSELLHLPYTRDLTEGGIAYAVRSLAYTYNRMGGSPYDRLRRIVAGVAMELAFRRYLTEQDIPYDVMGATPFTDPDKYDVSLGGRRCDVKSFLITYREQILQMQRNPDIILQAPALVPSDQHAGDCHSDHDLYLFAFLSGLVAASHEDVKRVIAANQPHYLIHAMPEAWARPYTWTPLGRLAVKSESEQTQIVEIGGQDEGREMRSRLIEVPPRTRVEIEDGFFSLAYLHAKSLVDARIGIHSPTRKEIHMIGGMDWGNIWVYGMDIVLAGYLTREEFSRRASPIQAGTRVFQYNQTRTKNLAVPIADLKPLSELFERVKTWSPQL